VKRTVRVSCIPLALALFLALAASPLAAQPAHRPAGHPAAGAMAPAADEPGAEPIVVEEQSSVTHHTVTIGGQKIAYTATAGTLVLKTEEGKPRASIFYVSYIRDGIDDAGRRPLTFSFNGGPGSSSVWLHLGALGPRRVKMTDEGKALPPPYTLVENPQSILDVTDLVFIDPVSTGFSRPAPGVEAQDFHGVEEDIHSVGAFIRRWLSANGRWESPKYLIGESYGTTRAANLVDDLQDRHGVYFNGVMLVSSILNFETARFDVGNDLPYPLFLPTYTATAWYHHKLPAEYDGDLHKALHDAEQFAMGDYALALMKGSALSDEERHAVAVKLARLTGLSVGYVEDADLRPVIYRFTKELLRDEGQTVGRLDSRFTGHDRQDVGEITEYDPSYAAIQGSFTATLNEYVRDELGFEAPNLDYVILGGRIEHWTMPEGTYVNVAEDLRHAMTQNPDLKIHVANGYYDLATPYFATRYTFDHMELPKELRGNVSMSYYEAGHMMYIRASELARLKQNLAAFIQNSEHIEK